MFTRLSAEGLPILCYHGISIADEYRWNPKLFMREQVFGARIEWLRRNGFHAIALGDALSLLERGELPRKYVVITFDDGWFGCLDGAFAKLAALGWPATLYVTTYYSGLRRPVFNVAVDYLLWRSSDRTLNLSMLDEALDGTPRLGDPGERADAARRITSFGDGRLGPEDRTQLLYRLAALLGHDPTDLFERRRLFGLLDASELAQARAMGIDVQLHTHRHRFPVEDSEAIRREIADNRNALGAPASELVHFCYPSGVHHPMAYPVLRGLNVRTATTTEPGLNFRGSEPLALSRFLDSDDLSSIEFHGELAGVGEVMRQCRSGMPPWSPSSPLRWHRDAPTRWNERNR